MSGSLASYTDTPIPSPAVQMRCGVASLRLVLLALAMCFCLAAGERGQTFCGKALPQVLSLVCDGCYNTRDKKYIHNNIDGEWPTLRPPPPLPCALASSDCTPLHLCMYMMRSASPHAAVRRHCAPRPQGVQPHPERLVLVTRKCT